MDEGAKEAREEKLTELRTLAFEKNFKELRKAAKSYLSRYGERPEAEEVRILYGSANLELGFYEEAGNVLTPLASREGSDRVRGEALILLADVYRAKGLFLQAAEGLLGALTTEIDESRRLRVLETLSGVAGLLSGDELKTVRRKYSSSPGIDIVLDANLKFSRAAGDTAETRKILEELASVQLEITPAEGDYTEGASFPISVKRQLGGEARFRIGLLCPLGGRFSPLGEAFLKGASIALKEGRRWGMGGIELIVADTRASPLGARLAAERLIEEENVVAMVGDVLSSPTIAAAQVAEFNKTVILSPVATERGIGEIGEWVFQAVPNVEVEIIAIARVACKNLGLKRIAFLSMDDIGFRNIELMFRAEVERLGGEICAAEFYGEGSSDFQENIEKIRSSDPEALYIASDIDDLVLILPQLSFYEFGVQLLGSSAWNSKRLLRMAGRDMEGAIIPAVVTERRIEERFWAAVAVVDESVTDINPFILGGYNGVRTILEALERSGAGGNALRGEMARSLDNRLHPFLEDVTQHGIAFYIVRKEKLEEFTTLKMNL